MLRSAFEGQQSIFDWLLAKSAALSGGGGAWKSTRQIVAVASTLVPESAVETSILIEEVK